MLLTLVVHARDANVTVGDVASLPGAPNLTCIVCVCVCAYTDTHTDTDTQTQTLTAFHGKRRR